MNKSAFKLFAAMTAMNIVNEENRVQRYERSLRKQNTLPPPPGCKEYFFNEYGDFNNDQMRKDQCVFKCVAINDKSAKKKFDKFINNIKKDGKFTEK